MAHGRFSPQRPFRSDGKLMKSYYHYSKEKTFAQVCLKYLMGLVIIVVGGSRFKCDVTDQSRCICGRHKLKTMLTITKIKGCITNNNPTGFVASRITGWWSYFQTFIFFRTRSTDAQSKPTKQINKLSVKHTYKNEFDHRLEYLFRECF